MFCGTPVCGCGWAAQMSCTGLSVEVYIVDDDIKRAVLRSEQVNKWMMLKEE